MRRALELAKRGTGHVAPNPLVGAVIVRDGRVLGEGWHALYGKQHAERNAIDNCNMRGNDARGATIYVTLTPCCHTGKQPPCTDAIVRAGIARVVIGSNDPNPLVAGKSEAALERNGVVVERGVLEKACDEINRPFFHFITTRTPYVVMKYAMTLDGKIACHTGLSRWVSGPAARRRVHETRKRLSAVMVGIGTVLADDPLLTCRVDGGRNPVRIVCDSQLRTPLSSRIVATAGAVTTIVACCCADRGAAAALENAGVGVVQVRPDAHGHLDLRELMAVLGRCNIDSVLLEGGAKLNWAAMEAQVVNEVHAYIAPKLFGGRNAPSPLAGLGVFNPDAAFTLSDIRVERVGDDLLVRGLVRC